MALRNARNIKLIAFRRRVGLVGRRVAARTRVRYWLLWYAERVKWGGLLISVERVLDMDKARVEMTVGSIFGVDNRKWSRGHVVGMLVGH
jgi:hypothetical protein